MKINYYNRQNKGITLIALVVTVVILIILAGVSISLVLGDNGIVSKAKAAKQNMEIAENEEQEGLANLEIAIQEGTNGGSGGNSGGSESEDTESGSGGDVPDESWKELTANERAERLELENHAAYLFYDGDANVEGEANKFTLQNHFNTIGYKKLLTTEATCECGRVREVFEKAKDMGLVKIYDQIETVTETGTFTNSSGEELNCGTDTVTAPITEPSLVYYCFEVLNKDQVPGGEIPMPYALNYETKIYGGSNWVNSAGPNFEREGRRFRNRSCVVGRRFCSDWLYHAWFKG